MRAVSRSALTLDGFDAFGGAHWESAALAHALDWEGVISPHSRRPLTEAMCFGIAGGIAAGYAHTTSVPGGLGKGVSVVGRHRGPSTGPEFIDSALRRLGAKPRVRETGSARLGATHLDRALASGHAAFVWCAPPPVLAARWANSFGTYVLLVHGVDHARGVVLISDRARSSISMPLRDLSRLRGKLSAHRRRVLTFTPPARLGPVALRKAIVQGIRAGAGDMLKPRQKAYNLPGLLEWSRLIAHPANRRGWPRLYRGRLHQALIDVYDSIETAGTGGGLYRPLYAAFLKEAAAVTGRRRLVAVGRTYASLGDRWSALARMALPDRAAGLRRTRGLLDQRRRLVERGGAMLAVRIEENREAMKKIEHQMRQSFPLDHAETMALLTGMSEEITDLHAAESRAARELLAAIQ